MTQEMPRREGLLRLVSGSFEIRHGHPLPLGATLQRGGVNFAVFSRHATEVTLVLFPPGESSAALEMPLDPRQNRTGDVWHVLVKGIDTGIDYGFRAAKSPNLEPRIHRFDSRRVLLDPYARAVAGLEAWGGGTDAGDLRPARPRALGGRSTRTSTGRATSPSTGRSRNRSSTRCTCAASPATPPPGSTHPGTYRGLVEKIPYLKELGVTAVELMPVTEFEESDHHFPNPGRPASGSATSGATSPCPSSPPRPRTRRARDAEEAVREFKEMVKALHERGHRGDPRHGLQPHRGGQRGRTHLVSLPRPRQHDLLHAGPEDGHYLNYSGCGNTLNCNHPVVRNLILDCLRYWVTEMHVDGFRFDLASILGRGQDGSVLARPAAPRDRSPPIPCWPTPS